MRTLLAMSFLLVPPLAFAQGAGDAGRGKPLYEQQCLKCHGRNGDGNGPAGRSMKPKPADFRTAKVDDPYWFKITKFGSKVVGKSGAMEGYGKLLTDDQIRDVLAYCKSFER